MVYCAEFRMLSFLLISRRSSPIIRTWCRLSSRTTSVTRPCGRSVARWSLNTASISVIGGESNGRITLLYRERKRCGREMSRINIPQENGQTEGQTVDRRSRRPDGWTDRQTAHAGWTKDETDGQIEHRTGKQGQSNGRTDRQQHMLDGRRIKQTDK